MVSSLFRTVFQAQKLPTFLYMEYYLKDFLAVFLTMDLLVCSQWILGQAYPSEYYFFSLPPQLCILSHSSDWITESVCSSFYSPEGSPVAVTIP